ncbi:MAG: hypothetical protein QOD75_1438 [Blastocatellia bacterium]|jgi:hypothetical protein|nr:hypothetical protein [Blastocatellia bacterium]
MFRIFSPIHQIEVAARRRVYKEFIDNHKELTAISVGCHNDMIILEKNQETEESVAILLATGAPGERVVFPKHKHTKGEATVCLEGHYGEYLAADENADDLFEEGMTLGGFMQQYPGVVELGQPEGDKTPVKLGPGARWSMGNDTEHKPFGWTSENNLLLAEIYWGGHNDITE